MKIQIRIGYAFSIYLNEILDLLPQRDIPLNMNTSFFHSVYFFMNESTTTTWHIHKRYVHGTSSIAQTIFLQF